MAHIVMAYAVMARIFMARIVMAFEPLGRLASKKKNGGGGAGAPIGLFADLGFGASGSFCRRLCRP